MHQCINFGWLFLRLGVVNAREETSRVTRTEGKHVAREARCHLVTKLESSKQAIQLFKQIDTSWHPLV
jgi:hypothetical protein